MVSVGKIRAEQAKLWDFDYVRISTIEKKKHRLCGSIYKKVEYKNENRKYNNCRNIENTFYEFAEHSQKSKQLM